MQSERFMSATASARYSEGLNTNLNPNHCYGGPSLWRAVIV